MNNKNTHKNSSSRWPLAVGRWPLAVGRRTGFTLIELLVVVLIIGILAAIALPQYQRAVRKSQTAAIYTIGKALVDATQIYKLTHGIYPCEGISEAVVPPFDILGVDVAADPVTGITTDGKYRIYYKNCADITVQKVGGTGQNVGLRFFFISQDIFKAGDIGCNDTEEDKYCEKLGGTFLYQSGPYLYYRL